MTDDSYISILGKQITCADERHSIQDLKFYDKNPRVLSKLARAGKLDGTSEEKQKAVEEQMRNESSVQKLFRTIVMHGGVTEPLIVQYNTLEVLEGNSRLAALRILWDKEEKEEYSTAPCRMIRLEEDQIDALLHQQHVEGKTEWTPYDKAYSAYHRIKRDEVDITLYAERTSASINEIEKQIEIVKLMITEDVQDKTDRFSYYEQIVRSNNLKSSFNNYPELKRHVLDQIKNPEPSFNAQNLRDKVPQIAGKSRVVKKWMKGEIEFNEAVELSKISQPKQYVAKALKNLKEIEKKDVEKLSTNDKNAFAQEVKKCEKQIKRIQAILARNRE